MTDKRKVAEANNMTRRTYSEETKAAAMAALLQGQSVCSVAKEYKVPKGTVSGWRKRAFNAANGVVGSATQKKERIGELLIEYISTSLETLKKQAKAFGNEKWLKEQEASQAAVLHGVIADKTIRLLEALSGPEDDTEKLDNS